MSKQRRYEYVTLRDSRGREHKLRVGDVVGFKYDVEQYATVDSVDVERFPPCVWVTAREGGYAREAGGSCAVRLLDGDFWVDQ